MPMALMGWRALKNATVRRMVSSGVVVGTSPTSRSSGLLPTAQTNLVPPPSIPPTHGMCFSVRRTLATIKTSMKLYKVTTYLGLFLTAGFLMAQQQPAKPAAPALAPATPAAPAVTLPPEATVVTIGAEKLTKAQFDQILAALAENGRAATTPAAKRQVANQLGEIMALAQEARKRKV